MIGETVAAPGIDLAALLKAVAREDRAAFARLYGATAPKLLGVAIRIVRDRQVAEDVVQDAFVKVWQGAGSYSPDAGRPMTWLIAVTRNRAIDVVRRRRETLVTAAEDGPDILELIADPRDREAEMMDAERLTACLSKLDETHRRCFVLAYLDGLSREELAQRFERPVNTIKTWLHRSAGALRLCLEER